ncbi:MAG: Co2+/Mg2+ efflux protein ApaG [Ferruginibacter sp.]
MINQISQGVSISVETFYQPEYSNPVNGEFMFAYKITIENNNTFPVRLLSRHWTIFDSNGSQREVAGEGVIGVQPLIDSGNSYQYVSGCNLRTEMGRMHGSYIFEDLHRKKTFKAFIPAFEMFAPFKLN